MARELLINNCISPLEVKLKEKDFCTKIVQFLCGQKRKSGATINRGVLCFGEPEGNYYCRTGGKGVIFIPTN
jgi:hypothetical protein